MGSESTLEATEGRDTGPVPDEIVTSIVLPVYNESGNLEPLAAELLDIVGTDEMAPYTPVEILFVDDGSSDGSRQVLRDLATEHDDVTAVFLSQNFGQSAALAAGIDFASGTYIVTMDSDRQNDPADIPMLLDDLASGYDCVSGWRRDRDDPIRKTVPSAVQTYLARLTGPDIHDFGCTLKAYRGSALETIELYGEGHRYIPAKLHKHGFSMTEREVAHRPRTEGETKYGWKRLFKGLMDLLFHIFWNRYSSRPLHLLGGVGLVSLGSGLLLGGHGVVMKYAFGQQLFPHLPRLILTIGLILFGLQLLMFGLLAEMLTKLYYQGNDPYQIGATVGDGSSDAATASTDGGSGVTESASNEINHDDQ